jgi:hypothetical protein
MVVLSRIVLCMIAGVVPGGCQAASDFVSHVARHNKALGKTAEEKDSLSREPQEVDRRILTRLGVKPGSKQAERIAKETESARQVSQLYNEPIHDGIHSILDSQGR